MWPFFLRMTASLVPPKAISFGKPTEEDDNLATTPKLTTTEMSAIRRMMGVETGPIAPITVNKEDYTHLPSMEGNEVSPDVRWRKK